MADSYIQTPPDSTGKKVRTQDGTVGANTVHTHYFILSGDDGQTALPWGGGNPENALAVNIAGKTTGGTWNYVPCELNPTSGEYGINVNVMPYGDAIPTTGSDADNSTNSTTKLPVLPARANTSAPTWTDGRQVPLSVDTAGGLRSYVTNTTIEGTVGSTFGTLVLRQGGRGTTANPTAVSDGQNVGVMTDDVGRVVTVSSGVRDLVTQQYTQVVTAASETTILTAGAGGVYHDITALIMTNKSAVQTSVTIKDATGGTTRGIFDLGSTGNLPLFFNPPFKQAAATANWTATISATATVNFTVQGVKNI